MIGLEGELWLRKYKNWTTDENWSSWELQHWMICGLVDTMDELKAKNNKIWER
jgi:hypothetical protein